MGAWEEQAKRTTQQRKQWSESQQFSFIDALQNATNEEEVKAAYIREFSLPVNTQEKHDLVVDKVLFEFKYSVKLSDIEVAAKVIAQAIYYINRLFQKGRLHEAEYLVVADKDEARIFKVKEFQLFYNSSEYQWREFRPSSPDPKLIEAVKNSKILESNRIYKLTSQEEVHLFSSRLYQVFSPIQAQEIFQSKPDNQYKHDWVRTSILIINFTIVLIAVTYIVRNYYINSEQKSIPVNTN